MIAVGAAGAPAAPVSGSGVAVNSSIARNSRGMTFSLACPAGSYSYRSFGVTTVGNQALSDLYRPEIPFRLSCR